MVDAMTGALTCPMDSTHMGITAENIADEWAITRQEQDELALLSHNRAEQAITDGLFDAQILPIDVVSRKKTTIFKQDEHVRFSATLGDYTELRPAFKKDGSVTAGNASGLNDAAAALILADQAAVDKHTLKPIAKIKAYAVAGVSPKFMGMGPVPAIESVLEKSGLNVSDID